MRVFKESKPLKLGIEKIGENEGNHSSGDILNQEIDQTKNARVMKEELPCHRENSETIVVIQKKMQAGRKVKQSHPVVKEEMKTKRFSETTSSTSSRKKVTRSKVEGLTPCRKKCYMIINNKTAKTVHDEYMKLRNDTLKKMYMVPLISVHNKKTIKISECEPSKQRNRQYSIKYSIKVGSKKKVICKGCFVKIFNVTKKFIETIINQKINDSASVRIQDKESHYITAESIQKLSHERVEKIRNHIQNYPLYYSRNSQGETNKKILPPHLTLTKMFNQYNDENSDEQPISRWSYEREFYNLGLAVTKLRSNTCVKCDKLSIMEKHAKTNFERENIKKALSVHQADAKLVHEGKQRDIDFARKSEGREISVTFGLQQCMPTPSLPPSTTLYKKPLWTFNLTCYNCVTDDSHNFMWHEGIAPRGQNQIASALYNFIMELPPEVERITFYSNSYGGQNENSSLAAMYLTALQKKTSLREIHQKFLFPGHTINECNIDHAIIERTKKRTPFIHVPRDYYNMIRNLSDKHHVTVMESHKQFDFEKMLSLSGPLRMLERNIKNEEFNWQSVKYFKYQRKELGVVEYKLSFNEDEEFESIDLRRHIPIQNLSPEKFTGTVVISNEKKKDLLSILHLVDTDCQDFYKTLPCAEFSDLHPDIFLTSDDEIVGE